MKKQRWSLFLILVLLILLIPSIWIINVFKGRSEILVDGPAQGGDVVKAHSNSFVTTRSKSQPNPSIGNPAAVYCLEMGYEYEIVDRESGQVGVCTFPDGESCDEWGFLEGKCGQDHSYCAQQGLGIKIASDGKNPFSQEYAVCVSEDGKEVGPVQDLMGLEELAIGCGEDVMQETNPNLRTNVIDYEPDPESTPPPSFDWRNYDGSNWVTPVKNQGNCGSCWAFSAVGVAEAVHDIGSDDPTLDLDLSDQYMVSDCHSYWGYQTCCGGFKDVALAYIRDTGIPDESCMSYVDGGGCSCYGGSCDLNCTYRSGSDCSDTTCSDRCGDWSSRLVNITSTGSVGTNPTTIKQALVDYGPLAVSVGIQSAYGGYWDGDIYRCTDDSGTNHAVAIVGYNDAGSYWIVRNSWGSGWNGDGYYKVGYGECAIENGVYYATAEPEMDVQGNGQSIVDGDTTPSTSDHTDFGSTTVSGGTVTRTFTIENTGETYLNLSGVPEVLISGTHASDFTVIATPSTPVSYGGGTTTFQVQFDPSGTGQRDAFISIDNNDSNENPYNFDIQGTGIDTNAPEMDVQGNGLSIADGDTTPSTSDHTDFGSTDVTGGTVTRIFTIENTGTADLNLTGSPDLVEITGTHASDFTVIVDPSSPIAFGGGTTTFQVQFDPSGTGLREASISIDNDDSDENPYDFDIQGTGASVPEMDMQGNGQSIADGDTTPSSSDHTDFGNTGVSGGTVTRTYTIENTGSEDLNLTNPMLVSISGAHATDFTMTSLPSTPVAAGGGTTTFEITFDPSGEGVRTAEISIANDDSDENPYNFDIQGTGVVPTFGDVPWDYWAYGYIEALYQSGITGGCSVDPPLYCPSDTVTRDQMAVFLERGIHGSGYDPPAPTGIFDDVPVDYWAAKWIEALYNDGITGGCGGNNYCPDDDVTRDQMAVFLLRSKHGSGYNPPAATGQFGDVPVDHWAADWIEQLAAEGITSGCGGGNYCPDDSVTRDQMAVFLTRTFDLPLP